MVFQKNCFKNLISFLPSKFVIHKSFQIPLDIHPLLLRCKHLEASEIFDLLVSFSPSNIFLYSESKLEYFDLNSCFWI